MKKKGKTAKQKKASAKVTGSYYYLTLNGNNPSLQDTLKTAMEEVHEYGGTLYTTHNSGQPPQNPPCPPGGCK